MRPGSLRPAILLAVLCWSSLLGGCSTFERDWKALGEASGPAVETGTGITGRWSGTWLSDVNGHGGGLRCIVGADAGGTVHARYHATYGGWLSFEYTVPMTVWQDGETHHFSGEADLGWLAGGRYEYEGTVVGDVFTSSYRSARDHGTFRMQRVRPAG